MSDGAVLLHVACWVTVAVAEAALLALFGSAVFAVTEALLVSVVDCDGALMLIVIVELLFAVWSAFVQTRVVAFCEQFHPAPVALLNVALFGSESLTTTLVASFGPLLLIVRTKATGAPPPTEFGEAFIVMATSAAKPIGTDNEPLPTQPFVLTVTLSETLVPLPALKVMTFVPWPAVIVPPLIDHVYVVPVGPEATDAELPVEFAPTLCGALIVACGAFDSVTIFDALALQPLAFVTVTL